MSLCSLCFFYNLFRFKAVATKSKLDLVNEGFTEFTIEDFHNTVRSSHLKKCMQYILLCRKIYQSNNANNIYPPSSWT